ncbi:MAG: sugar phosphate isomerase/epimerase [Kiritimatiellae bacterium]|jgi:D-psicose/D-tagatose/L-ribulose 3-epimerase|nr:sugar phosphate isomerase/epimerase [Kiritimatiellia bacterium]
MKIGINMLLWASNVTAEHRDALRMIKAAGADSVEIPVMEGTPGAYRELGKMLDDLGLARTSSMAFCSEDANPVSDDPASRQAAADYMKWLIECVHELGSSLVCGPMYQTIGVFSGDGPTPIEKARVVEMLKIAAPEAQSAGVKLAIEPLNRFECYMVNTLATGRELVEAVDAPNLAILFDTFHANMEEKDPVGAILKDGSVINHFHCSSNDRGIPGEGHIDWASTFKALHEINYQGDLVIEAFGRTLPGLAAATRIWRDMFDDAQNVVQKGIPFIREMWNRPA